MQPFPFLCWTLAVLESSNSVPQWGTKVGLLLTLPRQLGTVLGVSTKVYTVLSGLSELTGLLVRPFLAC